MLMFNLCFLATISLVVSSPMDEFVFKGIFKFCYKTKADCLGSARWIIRSCNQSCKCRGFHRGGCSASPEDCGPEIPFGCYCLGKRFGLKPDYCYNQGIGKPLFQLRSSPKD